MGCSTSLPQSVEDEIRDAMHAQQYSSCLLERVDDANGEYLATPLPDSGRDEGGSLALESDARSGWTETLTMATTEGEGQ